jgi:photosystem II stability/assembly factor-like uncharacterized protein
MHKLSLLALVFVSHLVEAQLKMVAHLAERKDLTFWALSVVDKNAAWVAANKGTVGRSTNRALTKWIYNQVKGFEEREFRSIYAFDAQVAIVACVGSPASILRTIDGGKTWSEVYHNDSPEAFIDGIDFWNDEEGLVYGDPIDGRMLLLRTADGGKTWTELPESSRPALTKGQASFASSGTGIRCYAGNKAVIATGGMVSQLFYSEDNGNTWRSSEPMLRQGRATGGIFSVAMGNEGQQIVVGGDFQDSTATELSMYHSGDGWEIPERAPGGTRWCVESFDGPLAYAVGPTGSDETVDGGKTWRPFLDKHGLQYDLHVIRRSRKGDVMVAAGRKGKLIVFR